MKLDMIGVFLLCCLFSACSDQRPVVDQEEPQQTKPKVQTEDLASVGTKTNAQDIDAQLAYLRKLDAEPVKYTLGIGDVISITVYGESDLSISGVPIRPDGRFSFPLIGDVEASNRSVLEVSNEIAKRLKEYIREPKVAVVVNTLRSYRYTIYGEVVKPGVFPLNTEMTLTQAIASSGGFAKGVFRTITIQIADLRNAFIARNGHVLPVDFVQLFDKGDTRFDIKLRPGDFISVPSGLAKELYILGEVSKAAQFPYKDNFPISKLMAAAEGFTPDADLSRIHVVRGTMQNPELTIINFEDVLAGKAQDMMLQAGDIVYVPPTYLTSFSRMMTKITSGLVAVQTSLTLGSGFLGRTKF